MMSSSSSARTFHSQYSPRFTNDVPTPQIDPNSLQQFRYKNLFSYGFKLSAVPSEIQWDDMHGDGDNPSDLHSQRPYPPTLSDPTSYDDGFGGYGNENSLDAYDQAEERQQRVDTSVDPNETFSPDNQDAFTRRRPAGKASSNPSGVRPPVQISIPSVLNSKTSERVVPYVPEDSVAVTYDVDVTLQIPDAETTVAVVVDEPSISLLSKTVPASTPESLIPSSHFHAGQTLSGLQGYDPSLDQFLSKDAYGVGATTALDELQEELLVLENSIYEQNNQCKFNINSPKQVAMALFGTEFGSSSTNKDVLEGMAGAGNRLAALILQYRATKYKLAKFTRQQESRAKGTAVRSALTVARPKVAKATTPRLEAEVPNTSFSKEASSTQLQSVMADPLLLLDASAYIFRAYYSMPPIHRPDGMPTGAVMGFCKMLNSLLLNRMLDGEQPRLVLCFDAKGKTFRHELFKEYKGNRAAAPMDLVPQFDLVRQAAKAYGISQIEAFRFEADDVIATLASRAIAEGVDTNIMSGDKDLMQLVTDLDVSPSVQIIDPMKKERTTYSEVVEKWEVPPQKLGDVLALAGDSADNVPGVRGIGPKTAAKLINEFGNLENLLNNINDVKQRGVREKLLEDEANARLSRILVELNRTVPMEELIGLPDGVNQKMGDLRMEVIDPDRILDFYDQMGFKELKRTFQNSLKGLKLKRKSSSHSKRPKATIPTPEDYKDVPF
jgi:5'-3' exonuclease